QEVGAARKRIDIGWSVPGSSSPYQRAPVDQTVSLSAEGVVGALYSASSGGSSITQTIILQGNAGAQTIFAASPQAQGTYQVHASATGIEGSSAIQTVVAPTLEFEKESITV